MKVIITENQKDKMLKNLIKKNGVEFASDMVGGIDNLFKLLDINSPMDFLHLFDDLEQVQSKEEKDWTLFRYKPKHNLMVYNRKIDYVYINNYDIGSVLQSHFGLNYTESQQLTEEWLSEVYNLRRITTHFTFHHYAFTLF